MKKSIIFGVACVAATFISHAEAYEFQNLDEQRNKQNIEKFRSTIVPMMKIGFDDKGLTPLQQVEAKNELASCLLDKMAYDSEASLVSMNTLFSFAQEYYYYHGTPAFPLMTDGARKYMKSIEERCADYHPQSKSQIEPRKIGEEAENRVDRECGWDDVETAEQFEAARECRIRIHKEVEQKYQ